MTILDNSSASSAKITPMRRSPDLHFMLAHPAHIIALGLGSGLPPFAPGTFGTLFACLTFGTLNRFFSPLQWGVFLLVGFIVGVWACHKTGRDLGVPDHGAMVWDEIIAMWLVLLLTPTAWLWQLGAFALFRFFDILKPQPIRYFDRKWKNGFGVMWDDLVAAFYALLVMALAVKLLY